MPKINNMLYSIYAESTPNPEVMKFVANRTLANKSVEINAGEDTRGISIAKALFNFPFIKSLYISSNFISISKTEAITWEDIAMQLRVFIADFLNEKGITNYTEHLAENEELKTEETVVPKIKFSDKEKEIEAILDQYIKPAVESDGGAITLESLVGNTVTVNLKGACSGCPSATSTLKGGIETLLKQKFHPDIEVVSNEA